jgi:sugar (pentulose or hexulose) kinase
LIAFAPSPSGGALRESPVWSQIVADVLGRDLTVSDVPEAALRGAVLLALESLGKIESIDQFSSTACQTLHHPECHKAYLQARERHEELYQKSVKQTK